VSSLATVARPARDLYTLLYTNTPRKSTSSGQRSKDTTLPVSESLPKFDLSFGACES